MSNSIIAEVSKLLRHTLFLGIKDDPTASQFLTTEDQIALVNPGQTGSGGEPKLSLWLYQILPNEHLRNSDFVRVRDPKDKANDDVLLYPPLFLNLLYLLTPSFRVQDVEDPIKDQLLLGCVLQAFHDQSILRLESNESPDPLELHLSLAPRTVEELAEVWEAMQKPYRLSICYEVRAVPIESRRRLRGGRAAERGLDFARAVER